MQLGNGSAPGDAHDGALVVLAGAPIPAGAEATVSYGPRSAAALLAHYGIPLNAQADQRQSRVGLPSEGQDPQSGAGAAQRRVEAVWRTTGGEAARRRWVRLPNSPESTL
mmetsp:Transcript_61879/g.166110  ORF Transcript_61879/g.166110 Transcript_61879/m.166110 type:complete len:110 (-) Transcript_61879:35-364(-)